MEQMTSELPEIWRHMLSIYSINVVTFAMREQSEKETISFLLLLSKAQSH